MSRQGDKAFVWMFYTFSSEVLKSCISVPRNRDPDGEDRAGLGLSQLPHHKVGENRKKLTFGKRNSLPKILRDYLDRQAKAEAFKAGEEEINEAINTVKNAGDTLKSTAEDAKKTMEDAKKAMEAEIGSNNDGACLLLPSVWLFVLVPKMMLQTINRYLQKYWTL